MNWKSLAGLVKIPFLIDMCQLGLHYENLAVTVQSLPVFLLKMQKKILLVKMCSVSRHK